MDPFPGQGEFKVTWIRRSAPSQPCWMFCCSTRSNCWILTLDCTSITRPCPSSSCTVPYNKSIIWSSVWQRVKEWALESLSCISNTVWPADTSQNLIMDLFQCCPPGGKDKHLTWQYWQFPARELLCLLVWGVGFHSHIINFYQTCIEHLWHKIGSLQKEITAVSLHLSSPRFNSWLKIPG